MRLLLDTHALIWHYEDSSAISDKAGQTIENPANQLFISAASIWEMAIKVSSGKLTLANSIREILSTYQSIGAALLAISPEHALATEALPWHHRDPFDRILIAQAGYEGLTLVSRDGAFDRYKVNRLW